MKAKLICSDGVEVEISEETEKSLRSLGEKKEFEPITVCHLIIQVYNDCVEFHDRSKESTFVCGQTLGEAKETIKAIQSAIDYIENK